MSPAVDEHEVRRIARLAYLKLTEDEIRLFAGELARIVEYVGKISSLNTDGVEPLVHPLSQMMSPRADKVEPGLSTEQALANAPDVERGCFRLPPVIGREGDA